MKLPETLSDAGTRYIRHMELDDMAALKICLLSTGTLLGLSCKGKFTRRLAGLTCSFLAAGLAIPLTSRFLDELKPGDPILGVTVERGEGAEAETLFSATLEKDPDPAQPTE